METARVIEEHRGDSDFLTKAMFKLEARQKLGSLEGFSGAFSTFEAEVPTKIVISAASNIVDKLIEVGLNPDAIVPSAEGGVAICFVKDGRYADIECLNSGETLAVKYSRTENPIVWVVDGDSTETTIRDISAHLSR